jgi:hypothetical protein
MASNRHRSGKLRGVYRRRSNRRKSQCQKHTLTALPVE